MRADLERMRAELEAIRGELRAMRELMQRQAAPQPGPPAARVVKVVTGDGPALGRRDAPVTIVEYSDYQCPFCRQFSANTLPVIRREYVDTGKVQYVFRDFPIDQIHPQARKAAEAARCAGDQGKYWEMHDLLFQQQQALQAEQLAGHATRLGLDGAKFTECLETDKHRVTVQQSYSQGAAAGVRGTPSFVIGRTKPDGSVEGLLVTGARPIGDFRQEIERLLSEK